jgi:hypothetical protein
MAQSSTIFFLSAAHRSMQSMGVRCNFCERKVVLVSSFFHRCDDGRFSCVREVREISNPDSRCSSEAGDISGIRIGEKQFD